MDRSILKVIAGEELIFDFRRGLFWPRKRLLLVADLHWGKTHYLRQHGVGISDHVFDDDLLRLSSVIAEYNPSTVLVLGDLIHHEKSLLPEVVNKVEKFREDNPCEFILLKGNHDKYTLFPESWGIVEEEDFTIDDFYFSHDFNSSKKNFQFSGHIHPMIRMRGGFDELRLPAFILDSSFCLLPAFSKLTGGQDIKLKKGQEALLILEDGLSEVRKR